MNRLHHWLCRSDHWRETLKQRLPWILHGADLGPNVLEIGPGPGLTTDLLRAFVPKLTALEIDPESAGALTARLQGTNVRVLRGDATSMPFGEGEFSSAVCFTMLHHVPSRELQDKVLHEAFRVLMPGGFFVGADSLQNLFMKIIHIGDTLVPVNPETFGSRLEQAGFRVVEVEKGKDAFRFRAQKPVMNS